MNDDALDGAWTTLDPTGGQRRRIDAQVFAWLDAYDTTLAAEWLGLFKVAPLTAFGLATVSAISLAAAPPLVWFATVLM